MSHRLLSWDMLCFVSYLCCRHSAPLEVSTIFCISFWPYQRHFMGVVRLGTHGWTCGNQTIQNAYPSCCFPCECRPAPSGKRHQKAHSPITWVSSIKEALTPGDLGGHPHETHEMMRSTWRPGRLSAEQRYLWLPCLRFAFHHDESKMNPPNLCFSCANMYCSFSGSSLLTCQPTMFWFFLKAVIHQNKNEYQVRGRRRPVWFTFEKSTKCTVPWSRYHLPWEPLVPVKMPIHFIKWLQDSNGKNIFVITLASQVNYETNHEITKHPVPATGNTSQPQWLWSVGNIHIYIL